MTSERNEWVSSSDSLSAVIVSSPSSPSSAETSTNEEQVDDEIVSNEGSLICGSSEALSLLELGLLSTGGLIVLSTTGPRPSGVSGALVGVDRGVVDEATGVATGTTASTAKTDASRLTGSFDASPPVRRRSLNDLVPEPANDPKPPEAANALKAPVVGVAVGVATVVVGAVVGEDVTAPKIPFGVVPGIDDDPNAGVAVLGFDGVVDSEGGVVLRARADTGFVSAFFGVKNGESLGISPKNPVAGLKAEGVDWRLPKAPPVADLISVAVVEGVAGCRTATGDGEEDGEGDLLSSPCIAVSLAAKGDATGFSGSFALSDGPAFGIGASGGLENTLVVAGAPKADFGWSSVGFAGSAAAQTGLAGRPSLFAKAENPPELPDVNALNAPVEGAVAAGVVVALAPGGVPNDDLPNNEPGCCVCPKLPCPNAGWLNAGCPKAGWPNAG